jgi:hypothetical protein
MLRTLQEGKPAKMWMVTMRDDWQEFWGGHQQFFLQNATAET